MKPQQVTDPSVRRELTAGITKICDALVCYARASDAGKRVSAQDEDRHAEAVEIASDVLNLLATKEELATDQEANP